jgi:hypothetical protein
MVLFAGGELCSKDGAVPSSAVRVEAFELLASCWTVGCANAAVMLCGLGRGAALSSGLRMEAGFFNHAVIDDCNMF